MSNASIKAPPLRAEFGVMKGYTQEENIGKNCCVLQARIRNRLINSGCMSYEYDDFG
jgi:hypothetical protein